MGSRSHRLGGRDHRFRGGHDRRCPERHQEGAGVFHGQPAGLHVSGGRHRRLRGGDLPHGHPRLLQGPALPRVRLGDPQHGQRPGHAPLRRPAQAHADHIGHLHHRLAGHRRCTSVRRLLVEGRDPRPRLGDLEGDVGDRPDHRDPHCLLHEPPGLHDLLRHVPVRRRSTRGDRRDLEHPCRQRRGRLGQRRGWHRSRGGRGHQGGREAREGAGESQPARDRDGRGRLG